MQTEVYGVQAAGYYVGEGTSGSTVKVTLKQGMDYVTCDGILIWEEELAEDCWEEWMACAMAGEEGYTAMIFNGDSYTFYGA